MYPGSCDCHAEQGDASDCLRGPISWLIVSPRFVTICGDYLNKHVQKYSS